MIAFTLLCLAIRLTISIHPNVSISLNLYGDKCEESRYVISSKCILSKFIKYTSGSDIEKNSGIFYLEKE